MVDRRELDKKTREEFKSYSSYEAVTVDETKYTYQLGTLLRSSQRGIVVTTTFKLNSLIKEMEENQDDSLKDKKIVFIIDEAHRTTMGQMMGTIKNHFKKNGLFYGFTGTPLFEENKVTGKIDEKSEVINTTEKLFGPLLHQYTIDEAIADKNVLGFNIDYANPGEFINHYHLKEELIEIMKNEKPDMPEREIQKIIMQYSDAQVEKEALKHEILVYQDVTHIPRVVETILENWNVQSQERFFNAILTVAYKERVINYYQEFKKQMSKKDININIAMTFSFGNENDPEQVPFETIEMMFEDYSKFTGIKFVAGDRVKGEENYFQDLVGRSTRGGSQRNPKNIDLIIVADQLLTGYDSKYLNTLYVDRNLQLQGLVQAYSRTNRLFDKRKEFGSIVNFRLPALTEEADIKALKLYGSGGESIRAIVAPYNTSVEQFKIAIEQMKTILPDPTAWKSIQHKIEEEKFIDLFKICFEHFNIVAQYYEYKWYDEKFGLDENTWLKYIGAYKNLLPEKEEVDVIIRALPGKSILSKTKVVDAKYLLTIIDKKLINSNGYKTVDDETLRIIYQQIQELSDMGDDKQAIQLREFVDEELITGKIPNNINFDVAFEKWLSIRLDKDMKEFSEKWGIEYIVLIKTVTNYDIREPEIIPFIEDITQSLDYSKVTIEGIDSPLDLSIELINELSRWLYEIKNKY